MLRNNLLTELLNKQNRQKEKPFSGIEMTIALRGKCNYACHYCVAGRIEENCPVYDIGKLDTFYQSLNQFIVTSLECGASEPTLNPQLPELIRMTTKYGPVSIPTNNSIHPSKWLPPDAAMNVHIRAALHPQGEEKFDSFLEHLLHARQMGAKLMVIFVAHPTRIQPLNYYRDVFEKHSIDLHVAAFTGTYMGKAYPAAYTDQERLELFSSNSFLAWFERLCSEITDRDFFGIPCLAGYRCFLIDKHGYLKRCLDDPQILDEPFQEAQPCNVHHCGCGLSLRDVNKFTLDYWNFWLAIANRQLIPTDETSDEIYQRQKDRYDRLRSSQ